VVGGASNLPGALIGLAGAVLFYWLPRSAWHRRRLQELYGEAAQPVLVRRIRTYTVVAILFLLIGLLNL
jgi:hypothetical protein